MTPSQPIGPSVRNHSSAMCLSVVDGHNSIKGLGDTGGIPALERNRSSSVRRLRRGSSTSSRPPSDGSYSRSNAKNVAGEACVSFAMREAAGWMRSSRSSNDSRSPMRMTISPSRMNAECLSLRKAATSSGPAVVPPWTAARRHRRREIPGSESRPTSVRIATRRPAADSPRAWPPSEDREWEAGAGGEEIAPWAGGPLL